jgi:hypothetical protein
MGRVHSSCQGLEVLSCTVSDRRGGSLEPGAVGTERVGIIG